jgi:glycosyltransferase involved in cell wall biosynthesis
LPAHIRVVYRGELAHEEVRRTFANYDAFILPTRGENFGHAIAESLSASCPVVCSDRTPWTSVLEGGGGTVLRELTSASLSEELGRLALMRPTERLQAKQLAGIVYRSWRSEHGSPNILEQARNAAWAR